MKRLRTKFLIAAFIVTTLVTVPLSSLARRSVP